MKNLLYLPHIASHITFATTYEEDDEGELTILVDNEDFIGMVMVMGFEI